RARPALPAWVSATPNRIAGGAAHDPPMPSSSSVGQGIGAAGAVTSFGRGRLRAVRARSGDAAPARRDLEIVAATVVGMAAVLDGPLVWVAAILLLAAMLLGTLQILADPAEAGLAGESGI